MLLWRLLRKNIVIGQLLGYVFATLFGLTIVLFSIRFYYDIQTVFSSEKGIFGRDFLVVSKKVNLLKTFGISNSGFSEQELQELKSKPFVKRMSGFTSSAYQVYASVPLGVQQFGSLLFFESVPDEFLDIDPSEWRWVKGGDFIPIVLPKSYLALYNFGFAPGQGLPQLSEKTIGMLRLTIEISGKKHGVFESRIVGFTDRVNTILVPQAFMDWSNTEFGYQTSPVSRIIIEPHNLTDPAMGEFFAQHNYDVANDKAAAGEASSFLRALIFIVMAVGGIITLLALGLMLLSINLLIQKNQDKIENLSLLGYPVRTIAFPYQALTLVLNVFILIISLVLVNRVYAQFSGAFQGFSSGVSGLTGTLLMWATGIVLILSLINLVWIGLKVKAIVR